MKTLYRIFFATVVGLLALSSGCATDEGPPCEGAECNNPSTNNDGNTCQNDEECEIGFACIDGSCQRPTNECSGDGDCPDGQRCIENVCTRERTEDAGTDDMSAGDGGSDEDGGMPTDELVICTEFSDYQNDEVIDRRVFFEYDDAGRRVRREVRNPGSSQDDYEETYEYDANGNLIRIDEDELIDGTVDGRETWTYNGQNQPVEYVRDSDLDGTPNFRRHFIYDADGMLVRHENDASADGDIDSVQRFNYDLNGHLREILWDGGNDGDINVRHTFEHDVDGVLQRYQIDRSDDGEIEELISYTYEEQGLVRKEEDDDADGTIDDTYVFTYDDTPLTFAVDYFNEILPEEHEHLPEYRPANRPTQWEVLDPSMTVTQRVTATYEPIGDTGVQVTVGSDYEPDEVVDLRKIYTFDLPENCGD